MSMRYSFFIGCTVLGLGAVAISGCSNSSDGYETARQGLSVPKIEVELATAEPADLVETIELVGNLVPIRYVTVVAEVDGVIEELKHERIEVEVHNRKISADLPLDIGMEVSEGDVLVRLDPTQHEYNLAAANARVKMAEAELANLNAWQRPEEVRRAEAAKAQAEANLALAEANMARAKNLLERDAISQADFDRAKAEVGVARASFERADADADLAEGGPTPEQIAVAEAALNQARAELDRAQWSVDKTVIRAPYDGVVTERYVGVGDRVTAMPRVEIMQLLDLSLLTAQLGVSERYIGKIQTGDPAWVYVKGSVEAVPGMVVLINDKVDPTSRTFRIRVAIENKDRQFKAGQFARVALDVGGATGSLTVPSRAVAYDGGEAEVFVLGNGIVEQRKVMLGISDGDRVEVLSGLAMGEQVVVDDPSVLADGMTVEVRGGDE